MQHPNLITGGGMPYWRNAHTRIGGLPKGQSSDANVTWVPSVPDLPIEYQEVHPHLTFPYLSVSPTPGPKTFSARPSGENLGPKLMQPLTERTLDSVKHAGT